MTLLLVDGHYLLYRSYFGVPDLRTSAGQPTNAIFAFAKTLRKLLAALKPTHGAVVWDAGIPQWRLSLRPDYKQQRPPMPDDLKSQEPQVMAMCPLIGLCNLCVPGVEADDLIASIALAADSGHQEAAVWIASADKDLMAILNDRIRLCTTGKAGKESPDGIQLTGPAEAEAKWGVPPRLIPDLLALTGDSSDNVAGVPGVGPKTAARLLRQFGSLETLLAGCDSLTPASLAGKITSMRPTLLENKKLLSPDAHQPLPFDTWDNLRIQPHPEALIQFLEDRQIRSLAREIQSENLPVNDSPAEKTASRLLSGKAAALPQGQPPSASPNPAMRQADFFAELGIQSTSEKPAPPP